MASSIGFLCGICDARHETKSADHWCPECDEGLCTECQDQYHSVSKATRNHDVIPAENYKKLPPSISEIEHYCKEHDMKYTNFCQQHNSLCCPFCISASHKDCLGRMITVQEIAKTSKSSALLDSLQQTLTDIKENYDAITKDRELNLSEIQKERQKFQNQIKEIRVKVNSHLDALEQQILTDLSTSEEKAKSKIEHLLATLSDQSKNVKALQDDILSMQNYASNLQTFLGIEKIEQKVEKEEQFLKSLTEERHIDHIRLKCNINEKINGLLSNITSFGSISIETGPPSVKLKTESEKQAQIMSVIHQPSQRSIKDIKLQLQDSISIARGKWTSRIRGCTKMSNGKMVLVDENNSRIIILKESSKSDKKISCPSKPWDITCVDGNTIAVSTNTGILLINIESSKTEKEIKIGSCCGIIFHEGSLLSFV